MLRIGYLAHSLRLHSQIDLELKEVCYRADKDDKGKIEVRPGLWQERGEENGTYPSGRSPEGRATSEVKREPNGQVDNRLWY